MKRRREAKRTAEAAVAGYDYSTAEAREETVAALFARARSARSEVEGEWQRYNDYYNFRHEATAELAEYCRENDLPWVPAGVPDPWIMVESQIDPTVPEPELRGRDTDLDSLRAREREYAVRYICENNRLSDMNTRNERRLLKYGDAFWKAYWDGEMRCGVDEGDIRIRDIPLHCVFPDPAVGGGDMQEGQYLDYVYQIHKVRFCQLFRADLERLGLEPEEILEEDYVNRSGLFDVTAAIHDEDDTIQVLEHWFRQPRESRDEEGNVIPAGVVACSVQAGGRELRYIPNYWKRTCRQNRLFPFVHYWRIQDENRFWNKSELFPILELVDAADRKLAMGLFNDAMLSNDVLLVEEGALADGAEISNEPGAVITTKPNRINGVHRLGGVQSLSNAAAVMAWFKEEIARTNRNYESNMGKDPVRQTTASGLAMLRSDAAGQSDIKKADRNLGFERLYELLDWLALEFFDDDRMIYLGAESARERQSVAFRFNADALSEEMPAVTDLEGNVVRRSWTCWPKVDVTVSAGEGLARNKQATLQTLQALTAANITEENWRLFAAQLEILDIPGRKEIVADWRRRFQSREAAETEPLPAAPQSAAV